MKLNKTKIRILFVIILALSFASAFFNFSKNTRPFTLGLDLQGGAHLVYEADKKILSTLPRAERESALEGVRDVIERRVNAFGVSEPLVQTSYSGDDYRIIVELAGVHDVNTAINMIGETPILEFKTQSTTTPELTEEEQAQIDVFNAEAEVRANEILDEVLKPNADFLSIAKEKSEDPSAQTNSGDLSWTTRGSLVPQFENVCYDELEDGVIHPSLVQTDFGFHIIKRIGTRERTESQNEQLGVGIGVDEAVDSEGNVIEGLGSFSEIEDDVGIVDSEGNPIEGISVSTSDNTDEEGAKETEDTEDTEEFNCQHILIRTQSVFDVRPELAFGNWENTNLSGEQLKSAQVSFGSQTGSPEVTLDFNSEGAKLFEQITRENLGSQVAIFLDNQPISTPTVQSIIAGGSAVITGNFTIQEAKLLAQRLNAGALRVPIELISQQTVGATLGAISVEKSLNAAMIGLLLVAIFMILYYRLLGVYAVVALTVYGLFVLALFKFIPVTLSLSGIAGFILSLGMAVDANVLIFERFKEELRAKNPVDVATDTSFKRAWTSIRDGNISTLITCVILIWFSSSIVKGFAITLSIGVLVSMFSAMVVTKILMKILVSKTFQEKMWLYGVKKE